MSEHIECCPFGCKAGMTVYQSIDCEYVICDRCESTGPAAKTREEAIAAWNKRAQPVGEARPPAAANLAGKWQPIETAPHNVPVLVYASGNQYVSWYQDDDSDPFREEGDPASDLDKLWCVTDNKHGPYALRGSRPTHWMHIPDAPLPESHALGGDGTE